MLHHTVSHKHYKAYIMSFVIQPLEEQAAEQRHLIELKTAYAQICYFKG